MDKPAADGGVFTYNGLEPDLFRTTQDSRYTITGNVRKDAGENDVTVKSIMLPGTAIYGQTAALDDLTYIRHRAEAGDAVRKERDRQGNTTAGRMPSVLSV